MSEAEVQVIQAVQAGDSRAFGTLYDQFLERIYRFIYLKTMDRPTAEDLTSQTFMKALEHIRSFDASKGSFSSWIYRIARNTVTDYYRARRSDVVLEDAWGIAQESTVERDTDTSLHMDRVQKYLKELSSREREIILMRVWGEASYEEIANALGVSEASCKMAYSRGIKKLRELMPAAAFVLFLLSRPSFLM